MFCRGDKEKIKLEKRFVNSGTKYLQITEFLEKK